MNNVGFDMVFVLIVDFIGLNYQGEGKGNGVLMFENFWGWFFNKLIFSIESLLVVSFRDIYFFLVVNSNNVIVWVNGFGVDFIIR